MNLKLMDMSLAAIFLMQETISPPAKLYFTLESTKLEEEASKVFSKFSRAEMLTVPANTELFIDQPIKGERT